ncbi:MAG TPA: hypothetical protein VE476_00160 [Propionibacteriaceae bacterium]|nr:hypothetical protein [Propionibacteriaceae bacterium]
MTRRRGGVNGGHSLPVNDRSWKYCTRCGSTVRDVDNHSKNEGGKIVACR